ncbi:MAG TPA: hypothetical protein VHS97_06805, partial [Isosphaeraceae bacterium]|nr:hypothetical protein [Isosphaeraceae bacterium]
MNPLRRHVLLLFRTLALAPTLVVLCSSQARAQMGYMGGFGYPGMGYGYPMMGGYGFGGPGFGYGAAGMGGFGY